jgi:hypothetical protein
MLRQVEFHIFLFFLLFLMVEWPLLAVPSDNGLLSIFCYLFLIWASFIFLLFLIQRTLQGTASRDERDNEGGG